MVKMPIYMDNNATTRADPRVVEAMLPYFTEKYGNAASRSHAFGWEAEEAVEEAREQIAALIGASAQGDHLHQRRHREQQPGDQGRRRDVQEEGQPRHHAGDRAQGRRSTPASASNATAIRSRTCRWTSSARCHAEQVREAMTDKTILVSIMAANNEIGTLQPIKAIGKLCKEKGVLFHTDAVQAVGKVPVDVEEMGIDLLSLSAHKLYGPKGIGALYVRKKDPRVRLEPQIDGGGHERGMRSGTLPVPLIVGLGKACEIARTRDAGRERSGRFRLRERLRKGIMDKLPESYLNGHPTERLPGNANISFAYVEGEGLMMGIKDVAVSQRLGLHEREPGAELRPAGAGRRRRTGPLAASASASAGSTPRRRSISWSTWSSAK